MLTVLGKFLRKLRIDNGELLKDMAHKTKVSSAMLSSVENGKRNPPADFAERVEHAYNLSPEQVDELESALCATQNEVKIRLANKGMQDRRLVFSFARQIDELDPTRKYRIMQILKEGA